MSHQLLPHGSGSVACCLPCCGEGAHVWILRRQAMGGSFCLVCFFVEQWWCCLWVTRWGFHGVKSVKLPGPGWEDPSLLFCPDHGRLWPLSGAATEAVGNARRPDRVSPLLRDRLECWRKQAILQPECRKCRQRSGLWWLLARDGGRRPQETIERRGSQPRGWGAGVQNTE